MKLFVRDKPFYQTFFRLMLVIALQNLIVFGTNLADNIMLGGYSETAMSGVAIVNQIQFLLQMIVAGIANGIVVISAQYWGKREIAPIHRLYAAGLRLGALLSAAMTLAVLLFPRQAVSLLTNEAAVIDQAVIYIKVMLWSYVIFAVTQITLGALRSVEVVRIGFVVNSVALVVNVTLNYLFIYVLDKGAHGAAVATLIARGVEFSIVMFYAFFIEKRLGLRIADWFTRAGAYGRDFYKNGLPLVLSSASWGIAMSVQIGILGRLGESAIGASSIANTIFQVFSVLVYGAGNAAGIVTGMAVGRGDERVVRSYAKTLQVMFLIIGAASAAAMFFCRELILSFYSVSEATRAMSLEFIAILSVTVVGTSYQMPSLTGIVAGGGDTKFVLYNDIIFMWGIVLPCSALSAFVFRFPPAVTFACLKSDQIMKCFVAVVKVNRFKWMKNLTRPPEKEGAKQPAHT